MMAPLPNTALYSRIYCIVCAVLLDLLMVSVFTAGFHTISQHSTLFYSTVHIMLNFTALCSIIHHCTVLYSLLQHHLAFFALLILDKPMSANFLYIGHCLNFKLI